MKLQVLRAGFPVLALAAFLVSGCFTGNVFRKEVCRHPDQFDSLLDSMLNDKRTWVDPLSAPR